MPARRRRPRLRRCGAGGTPPARVTYGASHAPLRSPVPDLLTVLTESLAGTYAVERELGRGGMATVFLAEDVKHGRQVAIKVLHPELASSMGAGRFAREIEIAARLQHPHILPLYDSGQAGEFLYYVMPLVEGESLRDRMNREKQLSLEDAIKLTVEVAGALSYAHSRGVVHRDIKPENVLLSGGVAVVADFGIARAVSAASDQSLTQTGTVVGTPAYMSPEQSAGSPDIDGRSDQYSLACMLYEMLVGEPPFTGPTAMAVMARHSMDAVSPPTIVRATIPDAVEDAILKALNKTPADRFATTQQFADALVVPSGTTGPQRRLTTRGTAARTPTGGTVLPSVPRVSRRALGIGAAVAVVLGVAGAVLARKGGGSGEGGGPDARRIAVLYFADQSEDRNLGYLADGFTEALIHELGQVGALEVISRNGVAPFKDAPVGSDSIARALNVGTIVEGALAQSGDRLRLRVALVNAATGAEIGSTVLERPRGDVFALQDDVAKEVAVFLRRRLGEQVQLAASRAATGDAEAWDLAQRAERAVKDFERLIAVPDTAAARRQLDTADSLLRQAEAQDRNWSDPVVRQGWIAYRRLDLGDALDPRFAGPWLQRGLEHADRALSRAAGDPDALELRGTLRYWRYVLNLVPSRDVASTLAAVEQDLSAAVAANPDQAFALTVMSHMLMGQSRTAEAKNTALRAYEADPYLVTAKTTLWRLFQASLDLGDPVESERWCDEGQARFVGDPRFIECQLWLFALQGQAPDVALAWRLLGDYEQAWAPAQRAFRQHYGQMIVAMAIARAGLGDSARRVAERARAGTDLDPTRDLALFEAIVHNLRGDTDEAIRLLNTYYAANPQLRASLARDETWWFRNLRDDPRYRSLAGVRG